MNATTYSADLQTAAAKRAYDIIAACDVYVTDDGVLEVTSPRKLPAAAKTAWRKDAAGMPVRFIVTAEH